MRSGANQRPWIFLAPKRPQLSCEMTGLHQEYKMQFAGQASSSKQTKEKKFITPCDVLGTHNFKGRPWLTNHHSGLAEFSVTNFECYFWVAREYL